jgi:MULE transposase domain
MFTICIKSSRLQRTNNDREFLRHSTEDMIFFGSDRGIQLLSDNEHWFADGSFYVAPAGYAQLYTIHVLLGETSTVPCVYVLLRNKTIDSYARMLQTLVDCVPAIVLTPTTITLDFETAAFAAFQNRFPQATLHGCFFHLSQSVWRRIQEAGLQIRYGADSSFALYARCLAAVAFLPENDVVIGFETLTGSADFPDELDPVVDYFESTYIGNIGRGGRRRRPLFSHALWSQRQRVIDNLPRTTNSLEGWHNAFNRTVNKAHASVPALASKLQQEEASVAVAVERFRAGHPQQKKKKKYAAVDLRLRNLLQDYNAANIVEFLRGVAHNITF